ncbi:hypothetical protein Tco_0058472 [Tanacetum coccineum]
MGSLSTNVDEEICITIILFVANPVNPKDSERTIQLADKGLPATHPDKDFDDDLKELSIKKCLRLVMEDAFPLHIDEASQPHPSTEHEVYNAVKEDPTLNKKVLDGVKAYTKNLSNLIELLNLVKYFTFPGFKIMVESLQAAITTQNAHLTQEGGSSKMTPRVDKGKGIATKTDPFPPKLVKASKKVCQNPNALILIDWEIDVKMVKIINDEFQAILDKKEQMKQVVKEVELSKPEVMKVATDMVIEAGLIDELNAIIPTKRNKYVKDLMTSLGNMYERLKKILEELGLDESLLLPEQDLSLLRKKRKPIELEPETYIDGIYYNKQLPEGVEIETLLGYKVMISNVKTDASERFNILMSKMISERPDKENILSKRVKLESLGYTNVSLNEESSNELPSSVQPKSKKKDLTIQ